MSRELLRSILSNTPDGVMLLEGKRAIPPDYAEKARVLAAQLARDFPRLRFRSGNAQGSDQAFSEGVAAVDANRLQVIAPYSSHRKALRYEEAAYDFPGSLSPAQEEEFARRTISATPKYRGLIENRTLGRRLASKSVYLIRDTMKVIGHSEKFPKPVFALFYADLSNPGTGGTGHTIRVCEQEAVPYVLQDVWEKWIDSKILWPGSG